MQHIICNRNVFTNFLPQSDTIISINETCLVTCAVSLTCATWLMCSLFTFDLTLNQDTSVVVCTALLEKRNCVCVCLCVCVRVCVRAFVHACVCTCVHVICVCEYLYICMYISS